MQTLLSQFDPKRLLACEKFEFLGAKTIWLPVVQTYSRPLRAAQDGEKRVKRDNNVTPGGVLLASEMRNARRRLVQPEFALVASGARHVHNNLKNNTRQLLTFFSLPAHIMSAKSRRRGSNTHTALSLRVSLRR